MFKVNVNRNIVSVQETEPITAGSVSVYYCKFTFDSSWDGFFRSAVFRVGATTRTVPLDDDNTCDIPWELLVKSNIGLPVEVSVYGTKAEVEILPTIWDRLGRIRGGSEPGDDVKNPSPSTYDRITGLVRAYADKMASEVESVKESVDEAEAAAKAVAETASQIGAAIEITTTAASAAAASSESAGRSATYASESASNAMRSAEDAEEWSKRAEQIAGGGVLSFNGRAGDVQPTSGDYTHNMVGAAPAVHTHTPDQVGAVNPNLLHNWYFANPVNQRGGLLIPPGSEYAVAGGNGEIIGTTEQYYQMYRYGVGAYKEFYIGSTLCATTADVVPGYVGAVYGIDRWVSMRANRYDVETATFYFGAGQTYQQITQVVENWQPLVGKTVTFSVLCETDTDMYIRLIYGTSAANVFNQLVPAGTKGLVSVTGTIPETATLVNVQPVSSLTAKPAAGSVKLIAAKLEIGSTQTLAHQDADGNWVLNEIPDFGEELLKCQRYFEVGRVGGVSTMGMGATYITGSQFRVEKRERPQITICGVDIATDSFGQANKVNHASSGGYSEANVGSVYPTKHGFDWVRMDAAVPTADSYTYFYFASADL